MNYNELIRAFIELNKSLAEKDEYIAELLKEKTEYLIGDYSKYCHKQRTPCKVIRMFPRKDVMKGGVL